MKDIDKITKSTRYAPKTNSRVVESIEDQLEEDKRMLLLLTKAWLITPKNQKFVEALIAHKIQDTLKKYPDMAITC